MPAVEAGIDAGGSSLSMQAWYAARFEREMSCTEAEWLRWLPGAVAPHGLQWPSRQGGRAAVTLGGGQLDLRWTLLPVRPIALLRLPRLSVCFEFEGVDEAARQVFMRHFDLYTQRGGG